MKLSKRREIACRTARWLMREWAQLGSDQDALILLDDFARKNADTVAAQWYRHASENQIYLFRREWRKQPLWYDWAEVDALLVCDICKIEEE